MSRLVGMSTVFLVLSLMALGVAGEARATTIAYGDSNRPILFEGVYYKGAIYDVSVVWNTNFNMAYALRTPLFYGDAAGAAAARDTLSQALVADGYTNAATQSFLAIPYDFADPMMVHLCISLHHGPTTFSEVTMQPAQVEAAMLYTLWDLVAPNESTTWAKVKALYR